MSNCSHRSLHLTLSRLNWTGQWCLSSSVQFISVQMTRNRMRCDEWCERFLTGSLIGRNHRYIHIGSPGRLARLSGRGWLVQDRCWSTYRRTAKHYHRHLVQLPCTFTDWSSMGEFTPNEQLAGIPTDSVVFPSLSHWNRNGPFGGERGNWDVTLPEIYHLIVFFHASYYYRAVFGQPIVVRFSWMIVFV